jgi:hypothetical protein
MSVVARRFNQAGLDAFVEELDRMRTFSDTSTASLTKIALDADGKYTEPLMEGVLIPSDVEFESRFEYAQYIFEWANKAGGRKFQIDLEQDRNFWNWLACLWAKNLLMKRRISSFPIGATERWVLGIDSWNRYYKHLLAGPYFVFAAHEEDPDRVRALLCGKMNEPGDVYESIAGRRELVKNPNMVAVVNHLYYDSINGRNKKGAASQGTPGECRRLVLVLNQFDRTYDVSGMDARDLIDLLPSEFDRFRSGID